MKTEGPDGTEGPVLRQPEIAEVILASAGAAGVEHLWFVSGSELTCFQEAAAKARSSGVRSPAIVTMMHEHVALSAAMGEAMVTGAPSMTAAHADLGLLHHGGAIHNAFRGNYPILMMSGYPATTEEMRKRPAYWKQQRWDQGSIVRQYVKWDHKVATYDDVCLVVARASQVMLTAPRGPAYLAVPAEVGPHRLAGDIHIRGPERLGIPRPGSGDLNAVEEIAKKLLEADEPLVITDRSGRDPRSAEVLGRICERFAVAVDASRNRMNLRDDHPSKYAATSVTTADFILVLECHVPWIPTDEKPPAGTWVAAVGTDPAALEIPLYEFPAHIRLTADPTAFLVALEDALLRLATADRTKVAASRWATFETEMALYQRNLAASLKEDRASSIISGRLLSNAVGEIMEPEDLMTAELGDTSGCPRTVPGTMFESGGSSLGWPVAAAAGALMTDRGRTAICLTGDGSYSFGSPHSLLWTQLQHDVPILTVVFNNRGYRTGSQRLLAHYPDGYAARSGDLSGGLFDPPPQYAAEATAAGGFGRKVVATSELMDALIEARSAVVDDRVPAVVDVWLPKHVTGDHPLETGGPHAPR